MSPPRLSVVIPAYDEEDYLPRTLEALAPALEALAVPTETIVADDASTDATAEIALRSGCRVVPCEHRQISRTRNTGAAEAQSDRILFLDADTEVSTEAVAAAWQALETGAVGGGCRMEMSGPRLGLDVRAVLAGWNALSRLARWAAGGFFFCRADAFRDVGGFPEDLFAAEEIGLSRRLKHWAGSQGGRFVILRERVLTSPRKAHLYSRAELRRLFGGIVWRGPGALRDRDAVSPWYDGRR